MISGFENKLHAMSLAILKRELSEKERVTFLELGAAIGMNTVEELLYMLMIFKRTEDEVNTALTSFKERIEERIDEICALEKKINDTLEASIDRVLGEGARAIGRNMGEEIAREARKTLTKHEKYHFLRGQIALAGFVSIISAVVYYLGAVLRFDSSLEGHWGLLESILRLPAGLVVLLFGTLYTMTWTHDYWQQIQDKKLYKARFALQILVLVVLLFYLLPLIL